MLFKSTVEQQTKILQRQEKPSTFFCESLTNSSQRTELVYFPSKVRRLKHKLFFGNI